MIQSMYAFTDLSNAPRKPKSSYHRYRLVGVARRLDFTDIQPPTPPKLKEDLSINALTKEDREVLTKMKNIDRYICD